MWRHNSDLVITEKVILLMQFNRIESFVFYIKRDFIPNFG